MKQTKTLLCALVCGATLLGATKAAAAPLLYLTSFNGTIACTTNYNNLNSNSTPRIMTKSVNLKSIMTMVTNHARLNGATNMPPGVRIAVNLFTRDVFLTNSSGFYYSLSRIVSFYLLDIATSFRGTGAASGTENDKVCVELYVRGYGPDGSYLWFDVYGAGTLNYSVKSSGIGTMSISASGGEYGSYYLPGSDSTGYDGVSKGSFSLSGSGKPDWSGPFSLWWWPNH
jgi:hypothetical protein